MKLSILFESNRVKILSWDLDGRIDWRDGEGLPWGFRGNATIELSIGGSDAILQLINYDNVDGPKEVLLDDAPIGDDLWEHIWMAFPPLLNAQLELGKSPNDKNVGPGHHMVKYVVEYPNDKCFDPISQGNH